MRLADDITPLLKDAKDTPIPISELNEDEEHQNISFLTGETGGSADKRVHLVIAHRLSDISKIEPEFFYALLQENMLLKLDSAVRARFVFNLQTELKPLIYYIALLDHKRDPQVGELGYPAWHRIQRTGKTAGSHSKEAGSTDQRIQSLFPQRTTP